MVPLLLLVSSCFAAAAASGGGYGVYGGSYGSYSKQTYHGVYPGEKGTFVRSQSEYMFMYLF